MQDGGAASVQEVKAAEDRLRRRGGGLLDPSSPITSVARPPRDSSGGGSGGSRKRRREAEAADPPPGPHREPSFAGRLFSSLSPALGRLLNIRTRDGLSIGAVDGSDWSGEGEDALSNDEVSEGNELEEERARDLSPRRTPVSELPSTLLISASAIIHSITNVVVV
jgi:hypothetical protein